tara:strand:- start:5156 stop:6175 length:1020 start_codon:yes stop_codon:yes gene_type:complete
LIEKTFVIAEAGSNHNGKMETARQLVKVAKDSGADAVKFQSFKADKLFSTKSKKVNGHDVFELFKPLEVSNSWLRQINDFCNEQEIEFMCTPFDEEAVDFLFDLGVKRIKISGFESTDLRFINYAASTKLPLIISAGLGCELKFVDKIIQTCYNAGNNNVTILHCNNAYPTPQEEINLETIKTIKNKFNVKVGLSDHTLSPVTPSLAVMCGASCIEKHFTLSKDMEGPDHSFAVEPNELKQMVDFIRLAEKSKGIKETFSNSEKKNSMQGRRSIVLKQDVLKGERVTDQNITTKRPFYDNNLPASDFFLVANAGYVFTENLKKDDFLTNNFIKKGVKVD